MSNTARSGPLVKDGAEPLNRRQLYLDESTVEVLKEIGAGNFSLGAREAARRILEHDGARPFSGSKKNPHLSGVQPDDGAKNLDRKHGRIDPESERILRRIGKGWLSLGVREAARRVVQYDDAGVFNTDRHLKRAQQSPASRIRTRNSNSSSHQPVSKGETHASRD